MHPIEVRFVGTAPSVFLATAARCHASNLCRQYPQVVAVDVVIELEPGTERAWDRTDAHYGSCRPVHVHLELHAAQGDVIVDRDPTGPRRARDDAYQALREAFATGEQRLRAGPPPSR